MLSGRLCEGMDVASKGAELDGDGLIRDDLAERKSEEIRLETKSPTSVELLERPWRRRRRERVQFEWGLKRARGASASSRRSWPGMRCRSLGVGCAACVTLGWSLPSSRVVGGGGGFCVCASGHRRIGAKAQGGWDLGGVGWEGGVASQADVVVVDSGLW